MKPFTRMLVALAAFGLALLGVAATASAAPYTNQLTVGVSNSSPSPGQTITVSGSGATPNGHVSFAFLGAEIGGATANASGAYSGSATIPSTACGTHSLVATDAAGNTASTTLTLPACVPAGGTSAGGGGLSTTGVAVASIGGVGVVLLLGGGLMLLLGRRRRATV